MCFFAISSSNSLQKSSAIQKISVTLLSVIMIQYLLFNTSKLLNISEIIKRTNNFFKLSVQLFYSIPYPKLAFIANMLLSVLQSTLQRRWSFSGLATIVRIVLMYYLNLEKFLNQPADLKIMLAEASESPPEVPINY